MTMIHDEAEDLAIKCLVIGTGLDAEPDDPVWPIQSPSALKQAWHQLRALSTALREAEAENARLRDALRQAVEGSDEKAVEDSDENGRFMVCHWVDVAPAALTQKETSDD